MATRQFALRLDSYSVQTGEITIKDLANNNAPVDFTLNHVVSGTGNKLTLATKKNGVVTNHEFNVAINNGTASTQLSAQQIVDLYSAAENGDWDYVEARWDVGQADSPDLSVHYMAQNGGIYNLSTWPPKPKK